MINEVGNKYSALTVIKRVENDNNGKARWLCKCDCGNEVVVIGSNLRKGNTKSCGCGIHRKKELESSEIGKQYGKLTVISFDSHTSYGKLIWKCRCECGNEVLVQTGHLHSGAQTSCGKCYKKPYNFINETGNVYGKLTVLNYAGSKNNEAMWLCKCECGNEIIVSGPSLRSKNTSSCGCTKSIGEYNVIKILTDSGIKFKTQYSFEDLKFIHPLKYDFCLLSDDNKPIRLIEFDGPQHEYTENDKKELFYNSTLQIRDIMKNEYAKEHSIPIIRIPYKMRDRLTLEDLMGNKWLINA